MQDDWISAAIAMIADPVVQAGFIAVLGGIALRFFLREYPAHAVGLRLGFLACVTAIAIHSGNAPYDPSPVNASPLHRVLIAVTKLVWWTTAAWFAAGCVRVFLRFDGQARQARVIQDLIVGLIYVGAVLSIIAYVFDAPIGTLVATSGVVAIILGLALQSTLGDLFSGIATNLARPFTLGDWIVLPDGTEGRIVEMNWRATHLLNGVNDLIILPNAQLAKSTVFNRSSLEHSHGASVTLRFVPDRSPSLIAEIMHHALLSSINILRVPPPSVQIVALDADAATLELSFSVSESSQIGKAKTELFDLAFRHAKAANLAFTSEYGKRSGAPHLIDDSARPTPVRLVEAMPLFASLTPDESKVIADSLTRHTHHKGEQLAAPGDVLSSLLIVRSGVVAVIGQNGAETRLAPGEYFGEAGMLTQAPENATYRALTNVVLYSVERDTLRDLLEQRPAIAEELAQHLAQRTDKLNRVPGSETRGSALQTGILARLVEQLATTLRSAR